MRYMYPFLLFFCLICSASLLAQSQNETLIKVFEKVLREKKEQWSKNNYNSIIYVPDAEMKKTLIFDHFKATSFDSVFLYQNTTKPKKFLYIFPTPVDSTIKNGEKQLKFGTGGYSDISEADLTNSLTYKGDTIIYKTDSNKSVTYPGTYGIRITNIIGKIPARLSYAWYLPDGYEYISYTCNKRGAWQRQGSLIHFVGDVDESNFIFDIRFRKKHAQPATLQGRTVEFTKTITIKGDHLELFVNDAQQEDGDIISLNLNGEWIVRGLSVTKAGAKINIPLPHKENYLVMHAENLGSIPPNTVSMQLNDGSQVHQITLNSDAGKSQGIKFVRP